ncbi:hypothetical protein BDC45DRAFT_524230 [Circinella umbellata]|nr:hypothetical protein BDC45DRAFT_524230 [Circinella umbellata]
MQDLKFTYAKKFTCIIRWDSPNTGRARQYIVEVGMKDEYEKNTKKYDNNTSNESPTLLHLSVSRNPHWRVASFLQDILNDKRDVVYLIQVLFQTLPFMMSLEKLELHNTLKGSIGDVSIIPRAVDSVRIIYVSKHALDIWFTNHNTMCVSDAAFLHKLSSISSSSSSLRSENNNKSTPSQSSPAITNNNNNTNTSGEQQKSGDDTTDIVKPVKLSQDFQFTPFTEFDSLLGNVETWIFEDDNDDDKEREEISCFPLLSSMDESEPTAVPFKHGVICSASLCRTLISQLGSLKQQEEKS